MSTRRLIAHTRANDPPPGITLQQWLEWRRLEDRRMADELAEQIVAAFELAHDDPTVH